MQFTRMAEAARTGPPTRHFFAHPISNSPVFVRPRCGNACSENYASRFSILVICDSASRCH